MQADLRGGLGEEARRDGRRLPALLLAGPSAGLRRQGGQAAVRPPLVAVLHPAQSHPEPALIKQARSSLWWDDSPALRRPQEIRAGARRAREIGVTGLRPLAGGVHLRRHRGRGGPGVAQGEAAGAAGLRLAGPGRPALRRVADAGPTGSPTGSSAATPTCRSSATRRSWAVTLFGAASTPQAVDDAPRTPGRLQHRADVVPALAAGQPRAGPGDEGPGRIDAARSGPSTGPPWIGCGAIERRHREPKSDGERGTSPDRPLGARPLGGRGRQAARRRPLKGQRTGPPRRRRGDLLGHRSPGASSPRPRSVFVPPGRSCRSGQSRRRHPIGFPLSDGSRKGGTLIRSSPASRRSPRSACGSPRPRCPSISQRELDMPARLLAHADQPVALLDPVLGRNPTGR